MPRVAPAVRTQVTLWLRMSEQQQTGRGLLQGNPPPRYARSATSACSPQAVEAVVAWSAAGAVSSPRDRDALGGLRRHPDGAVVPFADTGQPRSFNRSCWEAEPWGRATHSETTEVQHSPKSRGHLIRPKTLQWGETRTTHNLDVSVVEAGGRHLAQIIWRRCQALSAVPTRCVTVCRVGRSNPFTASPSFGYVLWHRRLGSESTSNRVR
jgi:hypothetical protein